MSLSESVILGKGFISKFLKYLEVQCFEYNSFHQDNCAIITEILSKILSNWVSVATDNERKPLGIYPQTETIFHASGVSERTWDELKEKKWLRKRKENLFCQRSCQTCEIRLSLRKWIKPPLPSNSFKFHLSAECSQIPNAYPTTNGERNLLLSYCDIKKCRHKQEFNEKKENILLSSWLFAVISLLPTTVVYNYL